MSSVSPTGSSFATSRSDASRFLSQSENDVAAAFAELFRNEGLEPASTPPPAAPPSNSQSESTRRGDASASEPTAQDATSQPVSAPLANGSNADDREDRDREREDERNEPVASAVAPATPQQQATPEQTPAATGESSEDQELEALLAEVSAVQKEAAAGTETTEGSPATASATAEGAIPFATLLPESQDATGAAAKETPIDPLAEAAPRIDVPLETEIVDPLRRGEPVEEESEEGFAIEDVADDANVDEEALAELLAKASGIEEGGRDAKTSSREDRFAADREPQAKASDAIDVVPQNLAEPTIDASVAAPAIEGTLSASKSESSAIESVVPNLGASASARREEPTGSLLRSTERSSDSDRRFASGADRSRFMDRVERAFQAAEQGDGAIRMRLHPGELGSMQLTLERGESGEWNARIETETAEAKQALLENASALKERLAEQDFRLARFEVETPADRRQQQDARDFQQNPQGFPKGRDRRDDEKPEERVQGESAPSGAASADRSRRLDVTI